MPLFALKSLLLCVLMVGAVYTCMLKNYTLWIEKQDCTQCVAINTTICSGYCYTQVTTSVMMTYQTRSCVPLSLVYRAAHIPGCPKDVNPQLYYPAAHCCSCRRCDTRTHRCVRTSRIPYDHFPHLPRALLQGHQTIHCFLSFTPSPAFHCNPNLVFHLTALSWQL
uniref:Gonadotropin subunit beta-2 n=1 Tax=Pundamilia nyererei TaxID=303518 RepID=A0A3B4GI22_9CICH